MFNPKMSREEVEQVKSDILPFLNIWIDTQSEEDWKVLKFAYEVYANKIGYTRQDFLDSETVYMREDWEADRRAKEAESKEEVLLGLCTNG